jgi:hypothetical protein
MEVESNNCDASSERNASEIAYMLSEIQNRIFSFNDVPDAYRCARVCTGWKECALDHVWFELENVKHVFVLLASLVESDDDDDKLVREHLRLFPSQSQSFRLSINYFLLLVEILSAPKVV